jgi:hypothetical protein
MPEIVTAIAYRKWKGFVFVCVMDDIPDDCQFTILCHFSLSTVKLIEATPTTSIGGILYTNERSFMSHFFRGVCE